MALTPGGALSWARAKRHWDLSVMATWSCQSHRKCRSRCPRASVVSFVQPYTLAEPCHCIMSQQEAKVLWCAFEVPGAATQGDPWPNLAPGFFSWHKEVVQKDPKKVTLQPKSFARMQNAQQTAMIRPVQMQRVASTRICEREDLRSGNCQRCERRWSKGVWWEESVKWFRVLNWVNTESCAMSPLYPHNPVNIDKPSQSDHKLVRLKPNGKFMALALTFLNTKGTTPAWMPSTEGISSPLKVFSMSLVVETGQVAASLAPMVPDMCKSPKHEFWWVFNIRGMGLTSGHS